MVVRGKGKRRKRPLDGGSYPKVLAKLYPDLQTLREAVGLVASFVDDSGELDGARGSHHSSRDGDAASPSCSLSRTPRHSHQDLANLLDETYVVFDSAAPDLAAWFQRARNRRRKGKSNARGLGEAGGDLQHRLVLDAVAEKFRLGKSASTANADVLCFGYRKVHGGSARGRNVNALDGGRLEKVERTCMTSVPADLLSTRRWEALLSQCGVDVVRYLLLYSSIFVTQNDASGKKYHLQASGGPIHTYVYRWRWHKTRGQAVASASDIPRPEPAGRGDEAMELGVVPSNPEVAHSYQEEVARLAAAGEGLFGDDAAVFAALLQEDVAVAAPGASDLVQAQGAENGGETAAKKKPNRPPSWKRRKLAEQGGEGTSGGADRDAEMEDCGANDEAEGSAFGSRKFAPSVKTNDVSGLLKIPRVYLYNMKSCLLGTVGFPRRHVLMTLADDSDGADQLLMDMFLSDLRLGFSKRTTASKKATATTSAPSLPRSLRHLKPLARHMIQKAKVCNCAKLLQEFCPSPAELERQGELPSAAWDPQQNAAKKDVLEYSTPPKHIGDFIWAVFRFITPKKLLGSKHNQKALKCAVMKFLCKKHYEEMTLDEAVFKLKTKEFSWFCPPGCGGEGKTGSGKVPASQQRKFAGLLKRWVLWVFTRVVAPLTHANFYATDAEGKGTTVYYFRHDFWRSISKHYLAGLCGAAPGSIRGPMLEQVKACDFAEAVKKNKLGVTHVRLLPKGKGMRLISNQSKATEIDLPEPYSGNIGQLVRPPINASLREAFCVIQHEIRAVPGILGASCFSDKDIYEKLGAFLRDHKARGSDQKLYMVSCDVQKAFDSIDAERILAMVGGLLRKEEYDLHKFITASTWTKDLYTKTRQTCEVLPPDDTFEDGFRYPHHVILNKASSSRVKASALREIVREHLMSNLVYAHGKFYKQVKGIPQGSVLSTLFCSLYLANLEVTRVFPRLSLAESQDHAEALKFHLRHGTVEDAGGDVAMAAAGGAYPSIPTYEVALSKQSPPRHRSVVLRFVDDYLFITTDEDRARRFMEVMREGFPDCGILLNPVKFSHSGFCVDGVEGEEGIRWCGLSISRTGEVMSDYSRLTDKWSVSLSVNLGKKLKSSLHWSLKWRVEKAVLFDTVANGGEVVRVNVYQTFLSCAARCAALVSRMSGPHLPKLVHEAIGGAIEYVQVKLERHEEATGRLAPPGVRVPRVPGVHVRFLGLKAFWRLMRRRLQHGAIVTLLERDLGHPQFRGLESKLADIIGEKNSSVFDRL